MQARELKGSGRVAKLRAMSGRALGSGSDWEMEVFTVVELR